MVLLRKRSTILQGYSRDVMAADNVDAIVSITSRALGALFHVPAVVLLISKGRVVSIKRVGDMAPKAAELEAAQSSLATGTALPAAVYPHLSSRFDFWPVQIAEGEDAVIGLAFDSDERPSAHQHQVRQSIS